MSMGGHGRERPERGRRLHQQHGQRERGTKVAVRLMATRRRYIPALVTTVGGGFDIEVASDAELKT